MCYCSTGQQAHLILIRIIPKPPATAGAAQQQVMFGNITVFPVFKTAAASGAHQRELIQTSIFALSRSPNAHIQLQHEHDKQLSLGFKTRAPQHVLSDVCVRKACSMYVYHVCPQCVQNRHPCIGCL
eukprot:GHUV01049455.1.p1 GENE.GHUV01049455.1~~GHUV01049455.1.p1  ORF type:complete len:127 (+),score=20.55 GHUV01049455.1:153-533(+)